jgi:hypothetical protein
MDQISRKIPEINSEQMLFSAEEWTQTPVAVQGFVLSLIVRLQALETEVADLREQLNRNSRNSSQPPSNDGPDVSPPPRRAKSERKRGGQPGHKGTPRKIAPSIGLTQPGNGRRSHQSTLVDLEVYPKTNDRSKPSEGRNGHLFA